MRSKAAPARYAGHAASTSVEGVLWSGARDAATIPGGPKVRIPGFIKKGAHFCAPFDELRVEGSACQGLLLSPLRVASRAAWPARSAGHFRALAWFAGLAKRVRIAI